MTTTTTIETTPEKPGFYHDVDFGAYVSWDAANASTLAGFSKTPAHVLYDLQRGGKKRTPSLDLGWLLHLAVLEPERFESEIVVPPKIDKRYKEGKAAWAKFEAEHGGKQFVGIDAFGKVKAMARNVLEHETAGEFFRGHGYNEVSILWEDNEHGVLCKARIDRVAPIGEWPIVGDLKSAKDASRRAVERSIHMYGYDVQAAHYLAGLEAIVPIPAGNPFRRFVLFVVESEAPHCVACYELDDAALAEGAEKRSRYIRKWRECVESGNWPGYPAGIEYASLPPWAFKKWEDIS